MGAESFCETVWGPDLQVGFEAAVMQARHECGVGGYTGTIAEKDEVSAVDCRPLPEELARLRADALLAEDPVDKWGPARALPLLDPAGVRYGSATIELTLDPEQLPGRPNEGAALRRLFADHAGLPTGTEMVAVSVDSDRREHRIEQERFDAADVVETRYLVGPQTALRRPDWERLYRSRDEAVGAAVLQLEKGGVHGAADPLEVVGVVRRPDGAPLARLARRVVSRQATLTGRWVLPPPADDDRPAAGWLLFGWASS